MTPSSQKADARPISFVLHDMATQQKPLEVRLVIRPEDLSIAYPSRVSVTQTLGSAWADSFGKGVPSINLSGTTGWRGGDKKDGLALFAELHATIWEKWHKARADALKQGLDPDLVKMIFSDALDGVTWAVVPNQFVLKRNKSRPLLAQYQISMTFVSDDVSESMSALKSPDPAALKEAGLESLAGAVKKIQNFANNIKGGIASALGPIKAAVQTFSNMTAKVLNTVRSVVGAVRGVVGAAAGALISIAKDLTKAGSNIMATVAAVKNLPAQVKGMLMEVKAAFTNAFCVLKNAFKGGPKYPTYDSLYGASTCSSTAGGRPVSQYIDKNPFSELFAAGAAVAKVTTDGADALNELASSDPVKAPMTMAAIGDKLAAVNSGVVVYA